VGAVLLDGFALWTVFHVVCTGYRGRTVGNCLFGIQVVRAEDPSASPGLRRAVIRWVLPSLAGATPLPERHPVWIPALPNLVARTVSNDQDTY
jgi:hypothetical protein